MNNLHYIALVLALSACPTLGGSPVLLDEVGGGAGGMLSLPPGGSATAHFVVRWRSTLGPQDMVLFVRPAVAYSRATLALSLPGKPNLQRSGSGSSTLELKEETWCNERRCDMEAVGSITYQDRTGDDEFADEIDPPNEPRQFRWSVVNRHAKVIHLHASESDPLVVVGLT